MPLIWKIAAIAVLASLLGLLLRSKNPELGMLLCIAAVCVVLLSSLGILDGLKELLSVMNRIGAQSLTAPLLKCVGIALITQICASLCKDCGQSALAAAVESAGTFCAAAVTLPLLLNVIKLIGGSL